MGNSFVLDVNIWISAIIGSKFHLLAKKIITEELTICVCEELLEELYDVLNRDKIKKYLNRKVSFYVSEIKNLVTVVKIKRKYNKAPDPDDNYLYDLCINTKSILVTGDKLLLSHKGQPPVKTITMKDFFG